MSSTCIVVTETLDSHAKGTDKTPAQNVLQIARDLHTLMTLSDYKNIVDVVPNHDGEKGIPDDVIALVTNGRITSENFSKVTDPVIVKRVMNQLTDLAMGLANANKDFVKFLNEVELDQNTINLIRYEAARGRIPLRMYSLFNMHRPLFGEDGRYDISGSYIQIINKHPVVRELDAYMKEMVDRSRTHGVNILGQYQKIIKDHSAEIVKATKGMKIKPKAFLEQTLKFFDPAYGLSMREDWYTGGRSNYENNTLLNKFVDYIVDKRNYNFSGTEEEMASTYTNLFKISLSAAENIWRLNYGREITDKMLNGEYRDREITWEEIPNDQDTILGLQKAHMQKISQMWSVASKVMLEDHRGPFERILGKFNLDTDEHGNPNAPIRTFYLPYSMNHEQVRETEGALFREHEEIFDQALMKFIGPRKTDNDFGDPTDNMTSAMFQRVEQLMFGVNTISHKMFARAAEDYASDRERNVDETTRRAIKAYASNVEIAGTPAKRGSLGVERLKQVLRLVSIFPALMISKPASGLRNLVGAGMGLFNADWHMYSMNADFKKALAKTDTDKTSDGYLAKRIDTIVDSGYISPGLASAFIDSQKFIEVLAGREGVSSSAMIDKVITFLYTNTMKFADWSVQGGLFQGLEWYRNIFTVPGTERILRAHVKNLIFQTAKADRAMISTLRRTNTEDIQREVVAVFEEQNDAARAERIEAALNAAKVQFQIASETGNKYMKETYEALINSLGKGVTDREAYSSFLGFKAALSDDEIDDVINISARYWKSHIDEQLGDFSAAGKPYIENVMLRDADNTIKALAGAFFKAINFFKVVGRTTSMSFFQGTYFFGASIIGKTGKEGAGWQGGIKGAADPEFAGGASLSLGLGTILVLYGMLAGLFKRNLMIGSALSANPLSSYVPPARLIGIEAFTIYGVLSGMGVNVPEPLREQIYKDNIRWFTGAIAGKSAAQLWEETQFNGRPMNPIKYIEQMAMDLADLPDFISYGLRDVRMDGDFRKYYDWRKEFNNVMNPVNHLAPVYLTQKMFETMVDINAPKDDAGHRILAGNIRNAVSNWMGAAVWTQVNEDVIKRPAFRRQRWETKADSVEEVMRLEKYSTPATRPQQQALANLHRRLRRYGAQSR